jgi:hypothetical protein
MQQVWDWLQKLGMGEYAQRFADNDIDFTPLSELLIRTSKKLGLYRSAIAAGGCVQSAS